MSPRKSERLMFAMSGWPSGRSRSTPSTVRCVARPVDAPDAAAGRRLEAHVLERALEAGEPLDHRAPGRDLLVRLDEEAERILDLLEGRVVCMRPPRAELAPEVAGRRDDGRDDPRRPARSRT